MFLQSFFHRLELKGRIREAIMKMILEFDIKIE